MGKRLGKRIRAVKEEIKKETAPRPIPIRNNGKRPVASENSDYIWCKNRDQYISIEVCVVKQSREPDRCRECEHYKD